MDAEKRIYLKTVRLTKSELEKAEKECREQEINFSRYVRLLLANDTGKIFIRKTKSAYQQDKQLIEEIRRIGVNINQIAANINGYYYSAEDRARLFQLMETVKRLLNKKISGGT